VLRSDSFAVVQARHTRHRADSADYMRKLCLREGRTERDVLSADILFANILLSIATL